MSNEHLKSQATSQTGDKRESRGPQRDTPTPPAKTGEIKKKKNELELSELLVGREDETAALENGLGLSCEVKHSLPHDSDHQGIYP